MFSKNSQRSQRRASSATNAIGLASEWVRTRLSKNSDAAAWEPFISPNAPMDNFKSDAAEISASSAIADWNAADGRIEVPDDGGDRDVHQGGVDDEHEHRHLGRRVLEAKRDVERFPRDEQGRRRVVRDASARAARNPGLHLAMKIMASLSAHPG